MISQYANSPVFKNLDNALQTLFDDSIVTAQWYNAVFDISTANSYGLDIWGKILNRSREFTYNGTRYYLQGAQTIGGISFTAQEMENLYRKILQLIAMRYIGNASISSINNMIQFIFANDGRCYCYEYATMHIRYVFEFYVSDIMKAIIETLNPHPTGVFSSFEYLPMGEFLGFYAGVSSITINNATYSRDISSDKTISGIGYYGWKNENTIYYTTSAQPANQSQVYTISGSTVTSTAYTTSNLVIEPYTPFSDKSQNVENGPFYR